VESANSNDNNFPYGSGEHLAQEMDRRFGGTIAAFVISCCYRTPVISIGTFLFALLEQYGVDEARYGAVYLDSFETIPELMEKTKEDILLMNLDFEVGT